MSLLTTNPLSAGTGTACKAIEAVTPIVRETRFLALLDDGLPGIRKETRTVVDEK